MQGKHWIGLGAAIGAIGVALGAFGAHRLPSYLEGAGHSPEEIAHWMESFETAARYHMYHAPLVVLVGVLQLLSAKHCRGLSTAGWLFVLGIALFSGSLYAWVFTAAQFGWLMPVVPIGGTLLIAGWVALAVAGFRYTSSISKDG